jgi:hypothetical protein
MTTYYCIDGATNNGDGTTSVDAAGTGAFNDALACLNGTESGLGAAPYTVIFKTNHSGSDISITTSSTLNLDCAATRATTNTWIFDDGTIWPGESGTFSIEFTGGRPNTTENSNFLNIIALLPYGLQFVRNYGTNSSVAFEIPDGLISNVYWRCANPFSTTSSNRKDLQVVFERYAEPTIINCKIDVVEDGWMYNNVLSATNNYSDTRCHVDGLVFNIIHARTGGNTKKLMSDWQTDCSIRNISIIDQDSNMAHDYILENDIDGLTYPSYMDLTLANSATNITTYGNDSLFDCEYKVLNVGATMRWVSGKAGWPTFNAQSVDGATSWSLQVDTVDLLEGYPAQIYAHDKYYYDAAAAKTITAEILIPNTFATPSGLDWWMVLTYEDSVNGVLKTQSTLLNVPISTSNAGWGQDNYNGIQYLKYKFELTTGTSVKQGSSIRIGLWTRRKANSSSEFYFIDPEVALS